MITAYYPDKDKWEYNMELRRKCSGELIEKEVNYVVNLEETIIIIKSVPAKVCSECGEQYFDDEISENIEKIVNQLKMLSTEISVVNYRDSVA